MELCLSILMQEQKKNPKPDKKITHFFFYLQKYSRFFKEISLLSYHNRLMIRISNITTVLKMAGMNYHLEITKLSVLSFQIQLKLCR